MLGRTIYEHTKRDIKEHASVYTDELSNALLAEKALYKAIAAANTVANKYHTSIVGTIFNRLYEIGHNAARHYAPELSVAERTVQVNLAIDELIHNKFYGLTFPQRLRQSHLNLRRNIKRSGSVGVKLETRFSNISRVFNESYPFGAQENWDTRLFLAEAVRLEHVIAKNIAAQKAYKLIRWTLSDYHSQSDTCDKLATAVDREVVKYIDSMHYDLDASGVYFIHSTPEIPHPNCQCTLEHVYKKRGRKRKRPQEHLNLIQRIIKALFG